MSGLDTTAFQALADEIAAEHHCPTVSWGVVADGRLVADSGTPDTVYRIASMSKSFTVAAVLGLRDDGVLSLDDPVASYAAELATVVGPPGSAPITLRRLMSMTSGLATDDAWADRHLDISAAEIDEVYRGGARFADSPGSRYEYSNLGFGIVGRVVRRVTGRPVQDHVTERLIEPLGLTRTTWLQPDHDDWARPYRAVDGASVPEGTPILGDGEIAPMGGLWSTVRDLATWVSWLDAGTSQPAAGGDLLSTASRREMAHVQTYIGNTAVAGRTCPAGYGFGLNLRMDPELGTVVAHAGGLPGYGSNMRWFAGRGVGAVALANTTYAPMSVLTMPMLVALHGQGVVPAATPAAPGDLDAACRDLVALLNSWSDEAANRLFADNMAADESWTRRAAQAAALVDRHGPLRVERIEVESATSATIEALGSGGIVRVGMELAPVAEPRIQLYYVMEPS